MKILMTNHQLQDPGGSELFILEMASALVRRGHRIAVYTSLPGAVAARLESSGIPVLARPGDCPFQPDLIHGQHHLQAMAALAAWPGVPALYFLHGAAPWEEWPPCHPRIFKYVGTSWRFAAWTAERTGTSPGEVGELRNFFDPERIPPPPPPRLTGKAGVFHNTLGSDGPSAEALAAGAREAGMDLEWVGKASGRMVENPASWLATCEVVFASGRSAIEAMASGCGVIPISEETLGERVAPANFDRLAGINFCAEPSDPPITRERVAERLRARDAPGAAEICARVRAEATLDRAVDRLEEFYREVLQAAAARPEDEAAERLALARYLTELAAATKKTDEGRQVLSKKLTEARARAERWKSAASRHQGERRLWESRLRRSRWRRWLWKILNR